MMCFRISLVALLLAGIVLSVAWAGGKTTPVTPQVEKEIRRQGQEILVLLKKKDFKRLAKYVHPQQGVRFSPWAYVDVDTDRRYTQTPLADAWKDRRAYMWGYEDGTGDPMKFTFRKYYQDFIFDRDFTKAPHVSFNKLGKIGNTRSNIDEVYWNAVFMEYHFAGTDDNDWKSLRLVFKLYGKGWRLVGIVHDEWTI